MEDYSKLKFNGDLSFLNDNLNGSSRSHNGHRAEEMVARPIENRKSTSTINRREPMEQMRKLNGVPSSRIQHENDHYSAAHDEMEMANDEGSQIGDRISHLEDMLLNSGRELERFNTMKIALLEMEKEKIINNYKQELIMMILKH